MGNTIDRLAGYDEDQISESTSGSDNGTMQKKSGKKRKYSGEESGFSPLKKVTKLDTAKYVYEKLFLQGEGSDVSIHAIGRVWNLHKLYLQQCKYFEVLLNGDWKDSKNNIFHLEFPDDNITVEGLHSVLGSLYHNEIEIDLKNIESVLSAASVLQLESVLERCGDAMSENLSAQNVLRYLNAAESYGLSQVVTAAFHYLKWNFWRIMKCKELLKDLREDTFVRLLSSSDLLIVEGEMDIYDMLKMWLFLREKEHAATLPDSEFDNQISIFFAKNEPGSLFLEHAGLFAALRLHHLVTTLSSLQVVEKDGLIPREIIRALMIDQWKTTLTNEENPAAVNSISLDDFYVNALRFGRLIENIPKCWRWTGFNNGVDIILNLNHGNLTMKRNCLSQSTPYSINLKTERMIHYRVIVSDSAGACIFDSSKQSISLRLDEVVVIARLGELSLPISVHLLYLAALPTPPSFLYVNQYVKSRLSQVV